MGVLLLMHVAINLAKFRFNMFFAPALKGPTHVNADNLAKYSGINLVEIVIL